MKKLLLILSFGFCFPGCSTSDQPTVVDESAMTPEQEAAQQAYVEDMDGPPPK